MCTRAHAPDPWKYSSQDSVHEKDRTKLNFDKKKKERERERGKENLDFCNRTVTPDISAEGIKFL